MSDFIKIAELNEIEEGGTLPLEVEGELICLAKVEGTVYAFTDNCTHISGPLNEGELHDCILTCPWHFAQFDIRTGKVLRGPARQDILTYAVKVEGEAVYIQLPDEE